MGGRIPWRHAYFLIGYDLNEPGLSYFFCELAPGAEPQTLSEAYEALKPQSVKIAEAEGKRVLRQGDMFFIETDRDQEGLAKRLDQRAEANYLVHDSNHRAALRAIDVNGLTYVQGPIRHDPADRRPDHKKLHLPGRRWWLCVKNTVPVTSNPYH